MNSCKKCTYTKMFTEKKGCNIGLYCQNCGAWQKWLNKNELRAFEYMKKHNHESVTEKHAESSKPSFNDDDKGPFDIEEKITELIKTIDEKEINHENESMPILNNEPMIVLKMPSRLLRELLVNIEIKDS